MKRLIPLIAIGALAACNSYDNDHYNNRTGMHTGDPGYVVVRPDGTYTATGAYVRPAPVVVVEERGYQPTHADDALSDRSMGNTRGSHGEPMSHVDADNDGNYDYQPYYSPYSPYYGPRARGYYYTY